MSLFDVEVPDATVGWHNLKAAESPTESWMNAQLERLWTYHEANADQAFRAEFARQPDSRFWEMYLTAHLIRARKRLLPRTEIARCRNGDKGPDIGVRKGKRVIWIEAIAPARGDRENLDEVPELVPSGTSQRLFRAVPRREVELRITGALYRKALIFRRYRADGIIGEKDSCIVAISAAQFGPQAITNGMPYAVSAVYPFGQEQFSIDRKTMKVVGRSFTFSGEIARAAKPGEPIQRTAFQGDYFKDISGIIWSRSTIGNFSVFNHDLVYVHNQSADRPIPRGWARWREEYYPLPAANMLQVRRRG